MNQITGADYFGRTGAHVLCLGAGDAALATLLHLIDQENEGGRAQRFSAVDLSQARLDHMRALAAQRESGIDLKTVHNSDPQFNDALMSQLPAGSIVINATGMGKDHPGSPLTDAGLFPLKGIAWELNYRGERPLLQQARRQAAARQLTVEDGWVYFVHGWSQVIAQVLHFEMTAKLFAALDKAALATK